MTTVNLAVDVQNTLGEGVLWCHQTQSVLWTDIQGATLWRFVPERALLRSWALPERLACFALTPDSDTLLLGLASGLALFRLSTEQLTPLCDVEPELATTRLNDGRCDRQGRFIFGTLNEEPARAKIGSYYRLNTDLRLERLPLPFAAIPNSICFSPDGSRMYYCDSLSKTIRCCDYGIVDGVISNDRVFVDLRDEPGVPDGSTVDSRGYVWNAQWGAGRVVRYAPDGTVERIVALPTRQPTCVAFGGKNLNRMYVTTARDELTQEVLQTEPMAGALLCVDFDDVRGLPESTFRGSTVAPQSTLAAAPATSEGPDLARSA